jgi:hypothetical protein
MDALVNHPIWDTIIIFWIFSAAVNAMPEPTSTSSGFYSWVYVFLTVLLGHVSDAIHRRPNTVPQSSPSSAASSNTKERP